MATSTTLLDIYEIMSTGVFQWFATATVYLLGVAVLFALFLRATKTLLVWKR